MCEIVLNKEERMQADKAERESLSELTRVWDYEQNRPLVSFPLWVQATVIIWGLAAFWETAFLSNPSPSDPHLYYSIFKEPWLLYGWFVFLSMVLVFALLRDPKLRLQRNLALIAIVISVIIVAIVYYYGNTLGDLLQRLLNQITHILGFSLHGGWAAFVLNYLIVLMVIYTTGQRWYRCYKGEPITGRWYLQKGLDASQKKNPGIYELISGDLLVGGAFFVVILSLIFSPLVWNPLVYGFIEPKVLDVGNVKLDPTCSPLPAPCLSPGATINSLGSLSFTDMILGLLCLIAGGVLLTFVILRPFARGSYVPQPGPTTARRVNPNPMGEAGYTVQRETAVEIEQVIGAGLTRGLYRDASADLLRRPAWFLTTLFSMFGLALAAKFIRSSLLLTQKEPGCHTLLGFFNMPHFLSCSYNTTTGGDVVTSFLYLGVAVISGLVAVGFFALMFALLVAPQVAYELIDFLWLITQALFVAFWVPSLVLMLINVVQWVFNNNTAGAFPEPDLLFTLSFAWFIFWLTRRRLRRRSQARATMAKASA
jgi:hypothetical protein